MKKEPTFIQSIMIFLMIIGALFFFIFLLKAEPHIPLLVTLVLAALLLAVFGFRWNQMEEAILKGIRSAIMPVIILSLIGILIAVWMMSGTVPTILYYGIKYISPEFFGISALFITVIISMFTGSSFTTVSTVGVALMGVAVTTGVNTMLAAGAIVCGACFGDKMSPLSDTTNFAPAVTGVSIFTHIQNMMYTTVPALIITAVFFAFAGQSESFDLTAIQGMQKALTDSFHIHWGALLPPLAVLYGSFRRKPIIPTLVFGIMAGLLAAWLFQGHSSVAEWFRVMQQGYKENIPNETVAAIVNRGGLQSMMSSTISLILIALSLGGLLQYCGVIQALFRKLVQPIRHRGSMVVAAGSSSIAVNLLTGEQYLSILLPGQMFKQEFNSRGIPAKTLSRTLEDCGTLINAVIPWGVSGTFFATTLHVPVIDFLPYAIFIWVSPLLTFAYALLPKLRDFTLYERQDKIMSQDSAIG
ncbi:Na+/H+ antiporter NhaC [Paenibacillus larvae]|nr:Na+/H+ antiporter NhaC [Paenibacillus larvae]MDR5567232.1 Na+/H+ antiporter NhaC [Paenibacillus larvae]MDR5594763.1 Na+/H+ antiporter NhaC [Paenibacillus larvae]